MAKHCNQCKQDYADELEACPRCTTAKITKMASRNEERTTQLVEFKEENLHEAPTLTDADVDLDAPPESKPAGDSGVNLAEEAVVDAVLDEAAEGDDSSGVDLAAAPEDSGEGVWAEGVGETELPASALEEEVVAAGDSGIDLSNLGQPGESTSDAALAALQADDSRIQPPAEADKGHDDLFAGMEETPAASADVGGAEQHEVSALDEVEEPITAGEAEDEKPAKPAKQRSPILALAGTALLGIVLGAGGTIAWQALLGSDEKPKAVPQPNLSPQVAKQAPPSFESQAARVAGGDWDEAKDAGIEMVQGANAKELVALGEYHLGTYLKKVGGKIDLKDPALQSALQNLQKAADQKDADAIYDLAFVKELAGQLPEALADYAKGVETFANDPSQKQRFAAAVARVEWKVLLKGPGSARIPLLDRKEDRAAVLALLLLALQQPPAPQDKPPQPAAPQGQQPAQADDKEAGYEFWNATKLARDGKFGDAIRTLDEARKLHDQRRFTRLRKAQNPLSDPAEDIFLRCCDELKAYWRLQNRLRDGGYLTDKNTPVDALQALLQKAEASAATAKSFSDKLVAAQVIGKDEDASKGLDRLIAEKKSADAKLADLKAMLQSAQDASAKLNEKLKTAEKTSADREAALTAAKKDQENLKTSNDALNATLKEIRGQLADAQLLGDAPDKANVVEAVKKAVEVAKTKDTQGMIRQQRDEIARLSASMKGSRPPTEMMPLWLLLLDENRDRTELANQAAQDVERVQKDPQASPARKGEAEVVYGLALRNSEQFARAKLVLETARGMVDRGEWLTRSEAALREVSNPAAYYSTLAQDLFDRGRMDAALLVLERAMKVLPTAEQGKLLAKRSLIELDAAQAKVKGPLPATEPLLLAARRDAEEAVKGGSAEGHYAVGRIAEALGQVDAAIKSYRAALAAYGNKMDADGGRYRMALARVLLQPRAARPGLPVLPPPSGQKVGWRDPAPYPAKHFEDMKSLVLMLAFGLQAPLLPGDDVGQEEAEKLADEVLKAPPGTVPFNVLAQALAVKGRWNAALLVYVEGIRPMLPREIGNGLLFLILNDPRLKRPDVPRIPNPMEAEKHFAAGLNFYFDDDYANAEQEFLLTIENDSQDARIFYFLGLSRLAQNRRREANFDFEQGAMLERLDRPSPAAVNVSLERIQGSCRTIVNEFRQRPAPVAP
ncbi:MAG: hypothetical protein ACYC3I_24400 [Gemmataceae bacterium]